MAKKSRGVHEKGQVPRPDLAAAILVPLKNKSRYKSHEGAHNWTLPMAMFAGKRACRDCGEWESDLKKKKTKKAVTPIRLLEHD